MNYRQFCIVLTFICLSNKVLAIDSLKFFNDKIVVNGLMDVYYNISTKSNLPTRPYSVSSNRNREMDVNLASIRMEYKSSNVRGVFHHGFGTYMNANYAEEPNTLKYLLEANVGVKLSKKKDIWLDAGILPSPYTNESPISKDQLMYTRTISAEYVPYFLSGLKLSWDINQKFGARLYAINGWQKISDNNQQPSLGTQLEYKPNKKMLINWNTYVGNEHSSTDSASFNRYVTDVYVIYNMDGKFSLSSNFYIGKQEKMDTFKQVFLRDFWQFNLQMRYKFTSKFSVSIRGEMFDDPHAVFLKSLRDEKGFNLFGVSACLNYLINDNVMFRLEGRYLKADTKGFVNTGKEWTDSDCFFNGNLCLWF
jgi:hypothetical protein